MDNHCTRRKHLDPETGIMTIEIDDKAIAVNEQQGKGPGPPKKAPRHGKQQLVRTPTPTPSQQARPWHGVELAKGDSIAEQLATGCGLRSKATVKSYLRLLKTVRQMCNGVATETIIRNSNSCIQVIEHNARQYKMSPHSVASYMNSVLAAIKHTVACSSKAALQEHIAAWQAAHKRWQLLAVQPYLQNRASEKQQKGWISYPDLCSVRDSLPIGSKARLLIAMYTHIPPCRADLGECPVLPKAPTPQQLAAYQGNYIVLQPAGTKLLSYLHLRQFKTSRVYAPHGIKTALPSVLVDEIRRSLQQCPRSFLFTQEHHANKPYGRSSFSNFANRTLQKASGIRDLNLQIVRHSYVTRALQVNDVSLLDPCDQAGKALCEKRLANIARSMAHSVEQQARYRFTLKQVTGMPEPVNAKQLKQGRPLQADPLIIELLN